MTKHAPATPLPIIARIYVGHSIVRSGEVYRVVGSRKLSGNYFYIVRDCNQRTFSMRREIVLAGQQSGEIMVTA